MTCLAYYQTLCTILKVLFQMYLAFYSCTITHYGPESFLVRRNAGQHPRLFGRLVLVEEFTQNKQYLYISCPLHFKGREIET